MLKKHEGTPWWWKDLFKLTGTKFTGKKSRGKRTSQSKYLPGVATSENKFKTFEPGKTHCPWVVFGFMTNGRELHVRLKTLEITKMPTRKDDATKCDCCHKRAHTQGIRESYEAGYEPIRKLPALDLQNLPERGLYGKIKANRDAKPKCVLLDPGQIHFVSIQTCTLNDEGGADLNEDWEALGGKEWKDFSGGDILNEYERERRRLNPEYAKAHANLSNVQKKTTTLCTFVDYCQEFSKSHSIIHEENMAWKKRSLKFKARIERQRGLALLANYIKSKGDVCFFGTGSCRGKGHTCVPVKSLMRVQGNVMPTFPMSEWGSSSRCPDCKSGKKMKSFRGGKECVAHSCNMDVEEDSESPVAAFKRSKSSDRVSGDLESLFITIDDVVDDRTEDCECCGKKWKHDVVSTHNFSHIANALVRGNERPMWLRPCDGSTDQ